MKYITFDEYYNINQFNSFINSAKNNGILFSLWISIRPPYNWYLRLSDKDLPVFVDYDIASKQEERYLIKITEPLNMADEYKLKRRETDSNTNYEKYVLNDVWNEIKEKHKLILFRYKNTEELLEISKHKEMKNSKIYKMGKFKNYKIALCTNTMILGLIKMDNVLFNLDDVKIKEISEIEAYINYHVLKIQKLYIKKSKTSYIMNGKYIPVKNISSF